MTELLCIETHSQGVVKAGQVYPMLGEQESTCLCGDREVDVGLMHHTKKGQLIICSYCNYIYRSDGIQWLSSFLFAQIGTEDECEQYREKAVIENQPSGAK